MNHVMRRAKRIGVRYVNSLRVKPSFGSDTHQKAPSFIAQPKTASVIGAPMTLGQPLDGTDHGPNLLRQAGLTDALETLGWTVKDHGDLDLETMRSSESSHVANAGGPLNCFQVCEGNRRICERVLMSCNAGECPVVLGGDHSVSLGSISGVLKARPDTGVIWVDAHADINNPDTSPSGNMHGMPVALLMKNYGKEGTLQGLEWHESVPTLSSNQIVYVGLRDIDALERDLLRKSGIKHIFTMHEIDKFGIGRVMKAALDHLNGRPLHLSYDIDAVDPEYAPATGTVVRGGLTLREAFFIAESVAESGMLGSMDMVEVNPLLADCGDDVSSTVQMGLRLIEAAMGGRIYDPVDLTRS